MGLFDKYRKNNLNESKDWSAAMKNNNANIDRLARLRTQVNIDPVMEEVIDSTEKADKNAKEVFTKLAKDASSIIPKDPGTGKKVTIKPYTEKLTLDENLFKESWNAKGSFENQSVKSVTYEEDDISDIAEELMNWYGEYFEGWEAADIKDALYGLYGERIPGSDCPIIFTMEESDEDEYDWGSDDDDEEYDESFSSKNQRCFIIRDKESGDYDRICGISYNDALRKARIKKYEVDFIGEEDEEYDESLSKKSLKENTSFDSIYQELKSFMRFKGYDVEDHDTAQYLAAAAEYIGMSRENGDWYSLEDWYKDTKMNYPEDLKDLKLKESLEKKSLSEDFSVEPGKVFTSKSGHKITIKSVVPYISSYNGEPSLKINYDFEMTNGKSGNSECNARDLFNMLNEDFNLLEYVNEEDVEDDDYTVYDLLNDRLFGYGINKSNFRVKWKFAEVEPTVKTRDGKLKRGYFYPTIHQDELTTGKSDDRRAFTEDGIGVFVHDEDEASLVKKCAEELNLDFVMKKLVRPHNGFNYIATIKVSDDIQEMPIKDYMESIGKSMSDLLRGKGDKIKSNFKDSVNYKSRKDKQDSK